jgi:hypothetical protein
MDEKPVNKNRTIIIVVAAIVAGVCCCLVVGVAGFYYLTTIRSVESSPTQPNEAIAPQSDTALSPPPRGGLGNDILRNDTWQVIAPAAVGLGCDQPIGANSTIEVLQQPDASGHWVEKWTVVCNSGDTYAFEVDFILDATGATFNIKSLP